MITHYNLADLVIGRFAEKHGLNIMKVGEGHIHMDSSLAVAMEMIGMLSPEGEEYSQQRDGFYGVATLKLMPEEDQEWVKSALEASGKSTTTRAIFEVVKEHTGMEAVVGFSRQHGVDPVKMAGYMQFETVAVAFPHMNDPATKERFKQIHDAAQRMKAEGQQIGKTAKAEEVIRQARNEGRTVVTGAEAVAMEQLLGKAVRHARLTEEMNEELSPSIVIKVTNMEGTKDTVSTVYIKDMMETTCKILALIEHLIPEQYRQGDQLEKMQEEIAALKAVNDLRSDRRTPLGNYYETMVFTVGGYNHASRCNTYEQAISDHDAAVAALKASYGSNKQ